eukprot:COSAG02_NODE_1111_length_14509_cov_3.543303_10_plen_103_part_00
MCYCNNTCLHDFTSLDHKRARARANRAESAATNAASTQPVQLQGALSAWHYSRDGTRAARARARPGGERHAMAGRGPAFTSRADACVHALSLERLTRNPTRI